MKAKHVWWSVAAVVTAGAVAATAGLGIAINNEYKNLQHGEPFTVAAPTTPLAPAPQPQGDLNEQALQTRLDAVLSDASLGTLGASVTDTTTGEVVWQHNATKPLLPASSTKVLTAAAATLALGEDHRITTEVVKGKTPGNVVIRAAGDVWLTDRRIEHLAKQIEKHAEESGEQITGVFVDTSVWPGTGVGGADQDFNSGWDRLDIDGGYIAPMQPLMRFGARIGETGGAHGSGSGGELTGDMPRSHTPALDVANRLAKRLGANTTGFAPAPETPSAEPADESAGARETDATAKVGTDSTANSAAESGPGTVLATSRSDRLDERAQHMMKHSDNVMAEAIGRELALERGEEATFEGATKATREVLEESGIDLTDVRLTDNCGLSKHNRIPAAVLDAVVAAAVDKPELRYMLGYLPVAGGDGTLATRYDDRAGRGYVRAKTGTLTGTSALAGTAVGESGRLYSFGMISNGSDINEARAGLDALASALREF